MTVIARDAVASDHLVYAWPFPLGPECEVTCADDEQVVMCPSWIVADRLGPGRHLWRTPDPMRPVAAFFVLTAPVEVVFDLTTSFMIPSTGQPVRLRAIGSVQVRCMDPGLLVAQFVGLPFDHVNDGVLRSVSRSVERMLARLLTRRVVMAASPYAVTDPQMLGGIIEELVAYNPTAGAVFGVELIRMGHLTIVADDGNSAYVALPGPSDWSGHLPAVSGSIGGGDERGSQPNIMPPVAAEPVAEPLAAIHAPAPARADDIPLLETARGRPLPSDAVVGKRTVQGTPPPPSRLTGSDGAAKPAATASDAGPSGVRAKKPTVPGFAIGSTPPMPMPVVAPPTPSASQPAIEVPRSPDEITQPGVKQPTAPGAVAAAPSGPTASGSGSMSGSPPSPASVRIPSPSAGIIGIGMGHIGSAVNGPSSASSSSSSASSSAAAAAAAAAPGGAVSSASGGSVSGEIGPRVAPGARVLVPGPNGLMQSATVRQLLSGYYELEVGSSGETIWVPTNGVVPE